MFIASSTGVTGLNQVPVDPSVFTTIVGVIVVGTIVFVHENIIMLLRHSLHGSDIVQLCVHHFKLLLEGGDHTILSMVSIADHEYVLFVQRE